MNRRDLIRMIAVATGGAMIGGEFFLTGCKNPDAGPSMTFSEDDIAFLDEVAETIFPKTASVGAKEAKVGNYMTVMVNDCYDKNDQQSFHKGIKTLDEACSKMHGHGFMKATPEQRKALLISLDGEAKEYGKKKSEFDKIENEKEKTQNANANATKYEKQRMDNHYFTQMKQLTIAGYFTSKEGRQSATRYEPVPGKYIGDLDYKKGDKIFTSLS
jgi:hypothetical protein